MTAPVGFSHFLLLRAYGVTFAKEPAVELDGQLRFSSGVLSTGIGPDFCPLRQFPLNGCRAADPCIRRDTVLCKKVFTLGLSLQPQLIR